MICQHDDDDVVDLGVASSDTMGAAAGLGELMGRFIDAGLSDD